MKIIISVKELIERDLWDSFSEIRGLNEYARAEDLVSDEDEFELTEKEGIKLGLLRIGGER